MKIVGVGLNKTGTKTLRSFFTEWGFRHRTFDLEAFRTFRAGGVEDLLDDMVDYDSFEDWPWPLMFREIDARYPDARFVLTVRSSPEVWYQSLCKMAVRMGPFDDFEKHIYGYSMPQGRYEEHRTYYERHNREVEAHFRGRPGKLLRICWEEGDTGRTLAEFVGQPVPEEITRHENRSLPVYGGDNLAWAHVHRVAFQTKQRIRGRLNRLFSPSTVEPDGSVAGGDAGAEGLDISERSAKEEGGVSD